MSYLPAPTLPYDKTIFMMKNTFLLLLYSRSFYVQNQKKNLLYS